MLKDYETINLDLGNMKLHTAYPSRHALGAPVRLTIGPQGSDINSNCEIAGIVFTEYGKVLYDVRVHIQEGVSTILKEVDSVFVVDKEIVNE